MNNDPTALARIVLSNLLSRKPFRGGSHLGTTKEVQSEEIDMKRCGVELGIGVYGGRVISFRRGSHLAGHT